MRRLLSILLLMLILPIVTSAQMALSYDITGAGSGTSGTALVKISVLGKTVNDNQLKMAAVHGVLFRGYSGTESRSTQPALTTPDTENAKSKFFNEFFTETGGCQNFAAVIDGSYNTIKTAKGYKVSAVVQVQRDQLRQYLEKQDVIKSLNSIF